MNNTELERLLKSTAPPKRDEEYWREFPKRVTAKLHWHPQMAKTNSLPGRRYGLLSLLAGAAGVCLVIMLVAKFQSYRATQAAALEGDNQLAAARKCYQELEALFPNQLEAIVFDQQGPRFVLAPKPDVPGGSPLYLKICGPKGCERIVTFSGQQVAVNGEKCEVLANGEGQVMLVGNHKVWTGDDSAEAVRVQARML